MKDSLSMINTDLENNGMDNEKRTERMLTGPPARKARPIAFGFLAAMLLYCLWTTHFHALLMEYGAETRPCMSDLVSVSDHKTIPLEAHIMSKCPDAQVCLAICWSYRTCLMSFRTV